MYAHTQSLLTETPESVFANFKQIWEMTSKQVPQNQQKNPNQIKEEDLLLSRVKRPQTQTF